MMIAIFDVRLSAVTLLRQIHGYGITEFGHNCVSYWVFLAIHIRIIRQSSVVTSMSKNLITFSLAATAAYRERHRQTDGQYRFFFHPFALYSNRALY